MPTDLALETETARLVPPGKFELGTAFEFQTSTQGQEIALPVEFEIGLVNNLELKVEPVLYTAILPSQGRNASGLGGSGSDTPRLGLEGKRGATRGRGGW